MVKERNGDRRFEDLVRNFEKLEEKVEKLDDELHADDKNTALQIANLRGDMNKLATRDDVRDLIDKIEGKVAEIDKRSLENSWKTKLIWGLIIGGASSVAGAAAYLAPDLQFSSGAGIGMWGMFGGG